MQIHRIGLKDIRRCAAKYGGDVDCIVKGNKSGTDTTGFTEQLQKTGEAADTSNFVVERGMPGFTIRGHGRHETFLRTVAEGGVCHDNWGQRELGEWVS